jgi:hypothetical protein
MLCYYLNLMFLAMHMRTPIEAYSGIGGDEIHARIDLNPPLRW